VHGRGPVAPRLQRAWEALGVEDVEFSVDDRSGGWLGLADPDQLDQVLWALLDNAVKYGRREPISATLTVDEAAGQLLITIADGGPGVGEADRGRLFARYERGTGGSAEDGSGLGLYVSRELCRAMDGDLLLEPSVPGRGAAFRVVLPAESPLEG
jgi:two-component system, OmpR family, sensor kinase